MGTAGLCLALLGMFLLMQLCTRMPDSADQGVIWNAIRWCGYHSLDILCMHMLFVEVLRVLDYQLFRNARYHLGEFEGIVVGFITVFFLKFPIDFISSHISPLFGAAKRIFPSD